MKRVMLLLAASVLAATTGFLPWKSHDAAQLLPVETLLIDQKADTVRVSAGTLTGEGSSLPEALEALAAQAPGELFFGQVSRVVVGDGASALLTEAAQQATLRLNTAVYRVRGSVAKLTERVSELEPYWRAQERHGVLTTLLEFCADGTSPLCIGETA